MKKMLIHVIVVLMLCSLVLVLPAASAENGKIVFTKGDYLYSMKADGSEQTLISDYNGLDHDATCSPDGTRIVFASNYRPYMDFKIFIMNTDGSHIIPLNVVGAHPSWTPDGAKIAFEADQIINSDGTEHTFLPVLSSGRITWSPDGTKFVFTSRTDAAICVINNDGTGQTCFTENGYGFFPAWSPDGTKIAFSSQFTIVGDIYTMNTDGSDLTRITFTENNGEPSWSPDGMKIVFTSNRDGEYWEDRIYLMNADGSDQTLLPTDLGKEPTWCPAPGSLEVKSSPAKAKIYINSIYTEQVTRWKFNDMAPGEYKVYVTLEGYSIPATETVKVISGQTASLHFKLDKIKKVK